MPNSVRRWAPRRCWNRTRGQQQPCPVPVPSHQPVRHGARSSLKLPAPSRLQQLGSPPVTGRLRERERGRGACSAIARISLPLCQRSCMPAPACLPFSVALAVWPGLWLEPGILPFPSLSFSCVFFFFTWRLESWTNGARDHGRYTYTQSQPQELLGSKP